MSEKNESKKAIQYTLSELEKQWCAVLADYPGTEYARIAEESLKKLRGLKAAAQAQLDQS